MIKTKIIETTEKYDKDGKLVEKFTKETTKEENDVKIEMDNCDDIAREVIKQTKDIKCREFCFLNCF